MQPHLVPTGSRGGAALSTVLETRQATGTSCMARVRCLVQVLPDSTANKGTATAAQLQSAELILDVPTPVHLKSQKGFPRGPSQPPLAIPTEMVTST